MNDRVIEDERERVSRVACWLVFFPREDVYSIHSRCSINQTASFDLQAHGETGKARDKNQINSDFLQEIV